MLFYVNERFTFTTHLVSRAVVLLNELLHFSIQHKMHSTLLSQQTIFCPHFFVHIFQEFEAETEIMTEYKVLNDDHVLYPMNEKMKKEINFSEFKIDTRKIFEFVIKFNY